LMGSLHTSSVPPDVDNYAFYVPDFFADTSFAHPTALAPFQAFNLAMTRKSTRNVDSKIAAKEALRFLANYPRHGMSLSTIASIFGVLLGERRQPHLKARRRALQPLITLDIFLHFMKRSHPGFATIHTNHVAAAMHRYWAAAFPNDVPGNAMPADWHARYEHEIEYAMEVLDLMLGRLTAFVARDRSYRLLIASSLGQAAVRTLPTKGFVSILNVAKLMERLGVAPGQWSQRFAMAPQISVIVDESVADAFERKLLEISVGSNQMRASTNEIPPLSFDRTGSSFQLYFYFEAYEGEPVAKLGSVSATFDELGLGFHPHQDEVACSARHTPHGIFIVYDPQQATLEGTRTQISTLDIAPALLDAYGIAPREYMRSPDRSILDPGRRTARTTLGVRGGGVERTVERLGMEGVRSEAV
jgi:hypothetical protein